MNSYNEWIDLAKSLRRSTKPIFPEIDIRYSIARAYVCDDGFYEYCRDVLGFDDLYEPFHRPICNHVVDKNHRFKMLQACRGSFKSSIGTMGKASRVIAKEFVETGAVNQRILIASESLDLSKQFVKVTEQIVSSKRWMDLYGDHKGDVRRVGWGSNWFTSRYRTLARLKEPTVSAMSLGSPKAGFHYEHIIADDLETERASATRDQIDKCWDFYRLLHSLLEPTEAYLDLISTRWHYDDIYSRIIERNKDDDPEYRFKILVKPAKEPDGTLSFPTRFSDDVLQNLQKKQGGYIFSCQYLLDPVPPEDRKFKEGWIRYAAKDLIRPDKKYRIFIGADFAYTQKKAIERGIGYRLADYTVIVTVAVDERWNYIILDAFRERCSKLEGVREMFRQYYTHKAVEIGAEKQDKLLVEDVVEQYAFQTRTFRPRIDWIAYPNRMSKEERIETVLQPLFESGKVYLQPGMKWLEQELLDFPRGAHDDGLDALVNAVHVSRPALQKRPKSQLTDIQRRIAYLKKGVVTDNKGDVISWKNF